MLSSDPSGLHLLLSDQDMNREVVKTDSATTRIPELDFEIPAFNQKGALATVEGLISCAISSVDRISPHEGQMKKP